jgi:ABC-type phosphate transport system ATPase subunit
MSKQRLSLEGFSVTRKERSKSLRRSLLESKNGVQITFIRGPSGCGKSTLVRSAFANEINDANYFFATSTFDQRGGHQAAPFAAIRELVADLFLQMTRKSDKIRDAVDKFLDSSHELEALASLLPTKAQS